MVPRCLGHSSAGDAESHSCRSSWGLGGPLATPNMFAVNSLVINSVASTGWVLNTITTRLSDLCSAVLQETLEGSL